MTIKQYLSLYVNDIEKQRLNGVEIKDLAKQYDVKVQTMAAFLIEHDIRWRREIVQEDIPDIIKRYKSGESLQKIGTDYHCDPSKISCILKDNNIHILDSSECHRIYTLNENYFDVIDTPNKAYILGLLYADGNRDGSSNTISICLQERDRDILDKINTEINSNCPLKYIDYSHRTDQNRVNQWKLSIHNKHLATSLYKYGLVPCKEFKTTFPKQIDRILWKDFIRGYMDGDGCIMSTECRWQITGNKPLLLFMKDYIEKTLNIHVQEYYHRNHITYNIRVAGRNQVKKLLDFLYQDAELYLERKYNLYQNMYCA